MNVLIAGQSNGQLLAPRLQVKMDAAFPNETVTVINAAIGGTCIAEWQKDGPPAQIHGRYLYADMLALVDSRPIHLIVKWLGEGDANGEAKAKSFRQGTINFVADCRIDFGVDVPFIIMQLGQDPDPTRTNPMFKYWWDVFACQATFDDMLGIDPLFRVKTLSTFHLPPDGTLVHKTTAGYNIASNNIISKYKNMMGIA